MRPCINPVHSAPLPQSSVEFVRDRLFNDRRYFICDKKLAELGWRERTPWREGLRKTVQWYLGKGRDGYWDEALVEVRRGIVTQEVMARWSTHCLWRWYQERGAK